MNSSAAAVRPIESRSVVEQVMTELRRSILSGALEPGREFSLRELAEMLQVSIIPVREALRSLESEGLVVTRPGRSALVAPLDLDELQGIYRLRRRLEPEIAQRSCRLLSDAELDRLEQQAVEFGAEHRTMNEIYDSHHAFHLALLAPAATSWDIRILSTLWRAPSAMSASAGAGWTRIRMSTRGASSITSNWSRRSGSATRRSRRGAVHQHLSRNEQTALLALGPGRGPWSRRSAETPVTAPRTRSIRARPSPGSRSPVHATYWSGRTSASAGPRWVTAVAAREPSAARRGCARPARSCRGRSRDAAPAA